MLREYQEDQLLKKQLSSNKFFTSYGREILNLHQLKINRAHHLYHEKICGQKFQAFSLLFEIQKQLQI
jgi:hypothetical protein